METENKEQENTSIESLFEKAEAFGKTSLELYRLKAIEKLAAVTSNMAANIVVITCLALFFLMLNIGIALWVGELLGKAYYGFLIIAGFYFLSSLILYAFRNKLIKTPVSNSIIDKALN